MAPHDSDCFSWPLTKTLLLTFDSSLIGPVLFIWPRISNSCSGVWLHDCSICCCFQVDNCRPVSTLIHHVVRCHNCRGLCFPIVRLNCWMLARRTTARMAAGHALRLTQRSLGLEGRCVCVVGVHFRWVWCPFPSSPHLPKIESDAQPLSLWVRMRDTGVEPAIPLSPFYGGWRLFLHALWRHACAIGFMFVVWCSNKM